MKNSLGDYITDRGRLSKMKDKIIKLANELLTELKKRGLKANTTRRDRDE